MGDIEHCAFWVIENSFPNDSWPSFLFSLLKWCCLLGCFLRHPSFRIFQHSLNSVSALWVGIGALRHWENPVKRKKEIKNLDFLLMEHFFLEHKWGQKKFSMGGSIYLYSPGGYSCFSHTVLKGEFVPAVLKLRVEELRLCLISATFQGSILSCLLSAWTLW